MKFTQYSLPLHEGVLVMYWSWLLLNFIAVILIDAHYEIYEETNRLKPYIGVAFDYSYLSATILSTTLFGVWIFRGRYRISYYLSLLLLIIVASIQLAGIIDQLTV